MLYFFVIKGGKNGKKTKQYLYVMNVAMNQQNGLENVLLVVVGIHFFEQKIIEKKNSSLKLNTNNGNHTPPKKFLFMMTKRDYKNFNRI